MSNCYLFTVLIILVNFWRFPTQILTYCAFKNLQHVMTCECFRPLVLVFTFFKCFTTLFCENNPRVTHIFITHRQSSYSRPKGLNLNPLPPQSNLTTLPSHGDPIQLQCEGLKSKMTNSFGQPAHISCVTKRKKKKKSQRIRMCHTHWRWSVHL